MKTIIINPSALFNLEHTLQTSGHRAPGRCLHRSARSRRVHLSRRGERSPALAQLVPEDRRGAARIGTDPTAGGGLTQRMFLITNSIDVISILNLSLFYKYSWRTFRAWPPTMAAVAVEFEHRSIRTRATPTNWSRNPCSIRAPHRHRIYRTPHQMVSIHCFFLCYDH